MNVQCERNAFELSCARSAIAAGIGKLTLEDAVAHMAELRDGDGYKYRYLNGSWDGWKAAKNDTQPAGGHEELLWLRAHPEELFRQTVEARKLYALLQDFGETDESIWARCCMLTAQVEYLAKTTKDPRALELM